MVGSLGAYNRIWHTVCTLLIFAAGLNYGIKQYGSDGKESSCNAGDLGSIPGLARSPGGGHDNSLQYSCLENPMGRGAWRAAVGLQSVKHDELQAAQRGLDTRARSHSSLIEERGSNSGPPILGATLKISAILWRQEPRPGRQARWDRIWLRPVHSPSSRKSWGQ